MSKIKNLTSLMSYMPESFVLTLARVIAGLVFFQSGLTKLDGYLPAEKAFFLFKHEYAVPLIPSDIATYVATYSELIFPIFLFAGLFTRLAALPLLGMTLVIQTFVYPDAYVQHGLWATALLAIIGYGPGRFSLDYVLGIDQGRFS